MSDKEELSFTADISQLMNLIINSFYSKKEIFLRELLSNASDALEKIRHKSLKNADELKSESELKIKVKSYENENKLVISDTGIGMTKDDLINCLGTIAKSGTKAFLENIDKKDVETIGQFGVGFYSSYLVAERVKVVTKNNDDKEYVWESNSDKTFTLTTNETPTLTRGTEIHLYLKEDELEYLKTDRVKEVIKEYTEFINYPIEIWETKEVEKEVPIEEEEEEEEKEEVKKEVPIEEEEEEEEKEEEKENDEPKIEEIEDEKEEKEEKEEKPKTQKVKELVSEWKVINNEKPIWCEKPEDLSEKQYNNFYKNLTGEHSEPLVYKHFHTEGNMECNSIIYIPEKAPFELFENTATKKKNIKLYSKKVFIMDNCEELIPEWLKFVKGVVDCNDIKLNVSREILQQSKVVSQIKNVLVKKSIELIHEISEDEDKFNKFYENYNKMLKLAVHEDSKNRSKLVEFLRYYSLNNHTKLISLKEYVENMKEEDKTIYYICGENKETLSKSPLIERIKNEGHDILYFTDPIDQYMIQNVTEYMEKKLVDVSKEGIKFDEEKIKQQTEENKELIDFFKEKLGERVTEVKVSDRLNETPCVLTTAEFGWTANMERIMKAQALRNSAMDQYMGARKIMELNPDHVIMRTLKEKLKDSDNVKQCNDIVNLLYHNAILSSGFTIENPTEYASRVNKMIEVGFCNMEEDDEDLPELVTKEENDEEKFYDTEKGEEESKMEEVD